MVIGWLLGGVIGIGSVIAMSTTGILIDFFLKILGIEQIRRVRQIEGEYYYDQDVGI